MTKGLEIQWGLPVDNPENNLVVKLRHNVIHIEIPVNLPGIGCMTIMDLLNIERVREILDLSKPLNTAVSVLKKSTVVSEPVRITTEERELRKDLTDSLNSD